MADDHAGAPSRLSRRTMLVAGGVSLAGAMTTGLVWAEVGGHMGFPPLPSKAELAANEKQWIDTITQDQAQTRFGLYPQPSRASAQEPHPEGSYQLYLPAAYQQDAGRRFPVIYWLHGGFGNARDGAPAVRRIDGAIGKGLMPPAIVVVPQALPGGWYVDAKDGSRPVEQVIVRDLIAHIDATYRTIPEAGGRTIEGMSMGGYGALHLGLKYPEVYGRISAVAPSILKDMSGEPVERTGDTFFGDEAYYAAVGPWTLALANAPQIRKVSKIRLLSGGADDRLVPVLREFDALMTRLGIAHVFHEVAGAGHDYEAIVDGIGGDYFRFWQG